MKTIKRISLSEQVVNSIIEYIQENDLKPGDQLPTESKFSEIFGVSRTSVREAIKALGINGVLTSIPGKGSFLLPKVASLVIDPDGLLQMEARTTITDVMEVRSPLEIKAVELAIVNCTDEEVETLEEICRNYRDAVEKKEPYSVWGRKSHAQIAIMSQNELLISVLQSLSEMTDLYRGRLEESDAAVDYYIKSHDIMCQAFRRRDAKAAIEEMRRHMEVTMKSLTELVNQGNASLFIPPN